MDAVGGIKAPQAASKHHKQRSFHTIASFCSCSPFSQLLLLLLLTLWLTVTSYAIKSGILLHNMYTNTIHNINIKDEMIAYWMSHRADYIVNDVVVSNIHSKFESCLHLLKGFWSWFLWMHSLCFTYNLLIILFICTLH